MTLLFSRALCPCSEADSAVLLGAYKVTSKQKCTTEAGTDIKICFSLFEVQDGGVNHSEEVITVTLGTAWCYAPPLPPGRTADSQRCH